MQSPVYRTVIHQQGIAHFGYFNARFDEVAFGNTNLKRDIETTTGSAPLEHVLITQPGLRYCQAQALVYSLVQDRTFQTFSEREKNLAAQRILEEVRGRMLEDIVLLETMKVAGPEQNVFKLQFAAGEFDMVVYGRRENHCAVFEVKHSGKTAPEQRRHLVNEENLSLTEKRFGEIVRRCVQ